MIKQDGFSFIELMIGMALLGVLANYSMDLMGKIYDKGNYSDLEHYTVMKLDFIAQVINQDHRMMDQGLDQAISASDCDSDGACATLTIKRLAPEKVAGKYPTITVNYKNVCIPMKDTTMEGTVYAPFKVGQESCVTRFLNCKVGEQRVIQVDTDYVGGGLNHAEFLSFDVVPALRKYFAGVQMCVVKNEEDDHYRVVLQAQLQRKSISKTRHVAKEIYLRQVSPEASIQRTKR